MLRHAAFLPQLIELADRSRHLGIHLIVAAEQLPRSIEHLLKSFANIRIALRMNDPADAIALMGSRDPVQISLHTPGPRHAPSRRRAPIAGAVRLRRGRVGRPDGDHSVHPRPRPQCGRAQDHHPTGRRTAPRPQRERRSSQARRCWSPKRRGSNPARAASRSSARTYRPSSPTSRSRRHAPARPTPTVPRSRSATCPTTTPRTPAGGTRRTTATC